MPEKSQPAVSSDTEAFWARCNDEEFTIQECTECSKRRLYPHDACSGCWNETSKAVVCKGTGTVKSYTVSYRPNTDAFKDDVPYIIALIELDEGVTVMSDIISASSEEVFIGMDVDLAWEDRNRQKIYQFKPRE